MESHAATGDKKLLRILVEKILASDREDLRNRDYVLEMFKESGVFFLPSFKPSLNHELKPYLRPSGSSCQQIDEFVDMILYVTQQKIETYLEIGVWRGGTFAIMTAFLVRLNDNFRWATGVDVDRGVEKVMCELYDLLPINFIMGGSHITWGMSSDLCFIDANHSYDYATKVWRNVGVFSKTCIFHDIVDIRFTTQQWGGGVKKLWTNLKSHPHWKNSDKEEFVKHPRNYFGIGVIHVQPRTTD